MEVVALMVEQLDADGTLRTFRMAPDYSSNKMVVAFADEYAEPRAGPFHFLDPGHSSQFERGFAAAQVRRVGTKRFYQDGDGFHFETSWHGIPTKQNCLTYYAQSLPEYAVPKHVQAIDPHSGRQYHKNVTRDDDRNRFVIYLECRSKIGIFDCVLKTDFHIDRSGFGNAQYLDEKTDQFGRQIEDYKWLLDSREHQRVQQFFSAERITVMVDFATISAAIGAATSAVGLFDKIADQIERFLTKAPEPSVPREHRLKIEGEDDALVARSEGKVVQRITAKDLEKLPESQLRHIKTFEKSMENHYNVWSEVYPQLAIMDSPVSKAKVNAQLKDVIARMKQDLNGILSFLETSGIHLDDHYIHIRQLVNQA